MKKIMVAAIAAVMVGGAYAACSYTPEAPKGDAAWVYNWKFVGKTTKGEIVKGTPAKIGACGYEGGAVEGGCVRVPSSLKIQGYTWYCDPGCGCVDFKDGLTEVNEMFYQVKPFHSSFAGGVTLEVCNIIGNKAKTCEVGGIADFTGTIEDTGSKEVTYKLVFAGMGRYDKGNSRVKSATGNFAGYMEYPWCVDKNICTQATTWNCSTLTLCDDPTTSIAYGKWTVKYNKSKSNAIATKGVTAKTIGLPRWASFQNM